MNDKLYDINLNSREVDILLSAMLDRKEKLSVICEKLDDMVFINKEDVTVFNSVVSRYNNDLVIIDDLISKFLEMC